MTKFIGIVLFLFCQNVLCQEYHFDRLIQYKETSVAFTGNRLVTVLFNSNNTSYYFVNRNWNDELDAYLVDNNLNVTHVYTIDDIKKSKDYEYLYSKRFNPDNCSIDCSCISIEESKNAGQFSKILMIKHINKKKKKKEYEIEVISKPYEFAVLKPLIEILQHHFLFCEEIKVDGYSIPTWIKLNKGGQIKSEQSLVLDNAIDVNFSVKKKDLVFRE
ncbi:hypothetical protein ACSVH2_07935 [Flavobacterium sp. RSB2_4_14]|uniref:hypothetical protein n=1 Tax=Flavobacterium sp. RSB2_4_14 TaxID=3447665 RepID=UPI003F3A3ED7